MNKPRTKLKTESNSAVYRRLARIHLNCPMCKPNKGENAKRKRKYGKAKPKYKDKRK